jgi:hypothetical protein
MGYLPQYMMFYATGVWANKSGIELADLIDWQIQKRLLNTVVSITLFGIFVITADNTQDGGTGLGTIMEAARGGFNSLAIAYAFWNNLIGILLSSFLLSVFRKRFNTKWMLNGFDFARYSYAAFLIHIPVVVVFQCLTDGSSWGAVVSGEMKTGVVGSTGVLGSWVVGWILVRMLDGVGARGYV